MRKKSAESEVMILIENHLSKVEESLQSMSAGMEDYLHGRMDSAEIHETNTHRAESEADEIRHKITDLLHRGAFLPLFREDMLQLVTMVDKIAGHARACSKFIMTQHPEVPEELRDDFTGIIQNSTAVLPPLQEAVKKLSVDFSVTRAKVVEVNQIEHVVDRMEWDLARKIFSTDLQLAHKMHLKQLADVIVGISDIAQDVGEILETLIVKKRI